MLPPEDIQHRGATMRHFLTALFLFLLPSMGLADHHTGNETVVVVSTRLAMVAEVEPITFTVTKVYKNGEDEVREIDLRDVPPGRDLTSWVQYVADEIEAAGFVRREPRPGEEVDENIITYVRPAPVIARFRSTITVSGTGTVTEGIDVALDLDKPAWPAVRERTDKWFDPSVPNPERGRIAAEYKTYVSAMLDRFIADNERRPVVLDEAKKQQLRQPSRTTVSQSRTVPVVGSAQATITVSVTSRLINRRLGVN